jgi:hypothetical protein
MIAKKEKNLIVKPSSSVPDPQSRNLFASRIRIYQFFMILASICQNSEISDYFNASTSTFKTVFVNSFSGVGGLRPGNPDFG